MSRFHLFIKRKWHGVLLLTAVLFLTGWVVWLNLPLSVVIAESLAAPLESTANSSGLLCRYGVNLIQPEQNLKFSDLQAGWYMDYKALATPAVSTGANYTVNVRLTQVGADDYTYSLNDPGKTIQDVANGNPGAMWLIGNEPDRRDFQDDLEPHVYAKAYHDLYAQVKAADSSARVYAGTIVQPTPLRLQYLDMVLGSYINTYGSSMPVDGWSIHNFILNEVSCNYDPTNCWGAEIPPGMTANYGEIIAIDDNDNINIFKQRIVDFRTWMKSRGYRHLPLTVSEYGVLMPSDFGFPVSRVNQFMTDTFDYMRTATDPNLGDPNDGYRLVQTWSWYSTGNAGDPYNGYLFDEGSIPWDLSAMGTHYRDYVNARPDEVDFFPSGITHTPATLISSGQPVTMTLRSRIANSGNLVTASGPAVVRFYDGDPAFGGQQIGTDQMVTLAGCGLNMETAVTWSNVSTGTHTVYVAVDPGGFIPEIDETNNVISQTVLVGTHAISLPVITRQIDLTP
ncbi:MAG: hypothetical protein GY796_36905 [Chloroflexi bacterium]|nr:hypothetical protein [Chloroflexota bacterium]